MKALIGDIGVFLQGLEGLRLWNSDVLLARFVIEVERFRIKNILQLNTGVRLTRLSARRRTDARNVSICDLSKGDGG